MPFAVPAGMRLFLPAVLSVLLAVGCTTPSGGTGSTTSSSSGGGASSLAPSSHGAATSHAGSGSSAVASSSHAGTSAGSSPHGASSGGGASSSHASSQGAADAGPVPSLEQPAPGEWATFKRDLAHTGAVTDMTGAINASNHCVRWRTRVAMDSVRTAGGPLIANINGTWTVFAAAIGGCFQDGGCTDVGGSIYALRGDDGGVLWRASVPGGVDPYAPLLADVDGDGTRELVVPAFSTSEVYAVRTQDEPDGGAGSLEWTGQYESQYMSEAAPTAANLDARDPQLEIVLGSARREGAGDGPAKVFVLDGRTGAMKGAPFVARRRFDVDPLCPGGDKVDSSSPALARVDGSWKVYVGAWDGRFYGLQWQESPDALVTAWAPYELPRYAVAGKCSVRKVRNGATVAALRVGGGVQVAFGDMADPDPATNLQGDFNTAMLRILDANGLSFLAELDQKVWKSTPSAADLDPNEPGLELAFGRFYGVTSVRATGAAGFEADWETPLGDGNTQNGTAGNRSSPALADLDDDGVLEVVLGVEGANGPGVAALSGDTGAVEWVEPLPTPGTSSSPAVGDPDGDGRLEIVIISDDGFVTMIDNESCL